MLKRHSEFIESLMLLADLLVISASWLGSYYFRFYWGPILVYRDIPDIRPYLLLLGLIVVVWGVAFKAFGLYRPKRISSRLAEVRDIARACTLAVLILIAATFFLKQFEFSRIVIACFWVFSIVSVSLVRSSFREVLRFTRRSGYNLRHVLIVGEGALARKVAERIRARPELGFRIKGLLVGDRNLVGQQVDGMSVLGTYEQAGELAEALSIDRVFIAIPLEAYGRMEAILRSLENGVAAISAVPDLHQYMTLRGGVEEFDGLPLISLQESPHYGWNLVGKRSLDIALSTVALLITGPLLLLVAAIIKLTSSGPVLYRQERMGLDGRTFQMLKFRSMRNDAEDDTGPVWAARDDERRTGIGALLRRTSLDELPQLVNVLKGEMSLVGPRPERPVFIEEFRKRIPRYMLRHKVKAGITGWAQVNGWRGDTSIEKRIECDLFYIENWSLFFDLRILWLSFWKGFIHRNAM
ncbi:UDP-phosphate glucose phosphotransferase [Candidatus Methylomirabilis lanthanidiphila]|uniref:UDP-phosphate glucose phosphotransferase n=1 Tax=Candidatus Methylomirabilis lanthanidiphila TaxID=2211376 RepID=A0A564ZIJ5_9BACT|nr:undecaprenyl-phosphate glucose phosphotransferase [Candidatus Methylomirabilis lanthanidiphila]VUZ84916.1 UDP-phosphate glucose phosphotransferase [Candidatus Methylomirabilis lanthanidiphila]